MSSEPQDTPNRNVVVALMSPDSDAGADPTAATDSAADLATDLAQCVTAFERGLASRPGEHTILVVALAGTEPSLTPTEPEQASSNVKTIWQQHTGGQHQRTLAGLRLALQLKGDLILSTPSHWTPTPRELGGLLDLYEQGARVVTGCRPLLPWDFASSKDRQQATAAEAEAEAEAEANSAPNSEDCTSRFCTNYYAAGDRAGRAWARLTTGSKRNDPASPIRLYDHQALKALLPKISANGTAPETALARLEHKAGFSVREIAIVNWR